MLSPAQDEAAGQADIAAGKSPQAAQSVGKSPVHSKTDDSEDDDALHNMNGMAAQERMEEFVKRAMKAQDKVASIFSSAPGEYTDTESTLSDEDESEEDEYFINRWSYPVRTRKAFSLDDFFRFKSLFSSKSNSDDKEDACMETSANLPKTWTQIHSEPNVYLIRNFLSEVELEAIENTAKVQSSKFQNSMTDSDSGALKKDKTRTSQSLQLTKFGSALDRRIECRAATAIGVPDTHVEPMQIVRYKTGQEYKTHHDAGELNENGDGFLNASRSSTEPIRIATFFCYITELKEGFGGETVFPKLGLKIRAERGMAVLFSNVDSEGNLDPRLIHSAQPPLKGASKLGLNIWISSANQHVHALWAAKDKKSVDLRGLTPTERQSECNVPSPPPPSPPKASRRVKKQKSARSKALVAKDASGKGKDQGFPDWVVIKPGKKRPHIKWGMKGSALWDEQILFIKAFERAEHRKAADRRKANQLERAEELQRIDNEKNLEAATEFKWKNVYPWLIKDLMWVCLKGKGLVDWYYIRKGESDIQDPTRVIEDGCEGFDYFTSQDAVLDFLRFQDDMVQRFRAFQKLTVLQTIENAHEGKNRKRPLIEGLERQLQAHKKSKVKKTPKIKWAKKGTKKFNEQLRFIKSWEKAVAAKASVKAKETRKNKKLLREQQQGTAHYLDGLQMPAMRVREWLKSIGWQISLSVGLYDRLYIPPRPGSNTPVTKPEAVDIVASGTELVDFFTSESQLMQMVKESKEMQDAYFAYVREETIALFPAAELLLDDLWRQALASKT